MMNQFRVDSHVPLSPRSRGSNEFASKPLPPEALAIKSLEVGQSIFFGIIPSWAAMASCERTAGMRSGEVTSW